MNIGIVGSRQFFDSTLMRSVIESLIKKHGPFTLVSGGAKGADSIAHRQWLEAMRDYEATYPIIHLPDTLKAHEAFGDVFRNRAFGRNKWIVDDSDRLVAFFVTPQPSGGTLNTLNHARRKGIPIAYKTTTGWFTENL